MEEFKTIKVLRETIRALNMIAAYTGEKQYEVVDRLAKEEKKKSKLKS